MDWDLKSYFSDFENPTYSAFKADLVDSLKELLERLPGLATENNVDVKDWETFLLDYEKVISNYSHLASYINCLTSAEAQNEAYQKEESALADIQALASKLNNRIIRGLGKMDEESFEQLARRDRLSDAAFQLMEWCELAQNRMDPQLEDLASDLGINGLSAWSRLYFTTMGNLKFRYVDPETGETETPMAQLNSLLSNANRDRRINASYGAAKTFAEHEHMYAAALNSISGTRLMLNKRRGIDNFLEPSIRQARLRATTLEALMAAIEDRLGFAREVFSFRNQCLGIDDPGYVDLKAPLPLNEEAGPNWDEGVGLISAAFNEVYPALGSFFDELIDKRWVDFSPRFGKRPGGFCTGSLATRESRIFMTYKDTLNDVLTLAHEAGHAWHSRILKDERVLATNYPMTLAETASTFAERVFAEGVLNNHDLDKSVHLIILDAEVEHMLAFLLDLPVRFHFEREVYERRKSGTLSPRELCELMKATQRKIFGASLAEEREDPWFWASKLHFYISGVEFYNYPYTFGYLLSTGFMKLFHEEGSSALNAYEQFLAKSGKMSCEEVVLETLGADIDDPNFWAAMIDNLQLSFRKYKALIEDLYA